MLRANIGGVEEIEEDEMDEEEMREDETEEDDTVLEELDEYAVSTRNWWTSNSEVFSVSRSSIVLLPEINCTDTALSSAPVGRGAVVELMERVATRVLFTHKLIDRVPESDAALI